MSFGVVGVGVPTPLGHECSTRLLQAAAPSLSEDLNKTGLGLADVAAFFCAKWGEWTSMSLPLPQPMDALSQHIVDTDLLLKSFFSEILICCKKLKNWSMFSLVLLWPDWCSHPLFSPHWTNCKNAMQIGNSLDGSQMICANLCRVKSSKCFKSCGAACNC